MRKSSPCQHYHNFLSEIEDIDIISMCANIRKFIPSRTYIERWTEPATDDLSTTERIVAPQFALATFFLEGLECYSTQFLPAPSVSENCLAKLRPHLDPSHPLSQPVSAKGVRRHRVAYFYV
jgi:hypothetical protein